MKQLRYYFLLCVFLTCLHAFGSDKNDFDKRFNLLPKPQQVDLLQERGVSATALRSLLLKGSAIRPPISGVLGNLPLAATPAAGVLVLSITTDTDLPASGEGYILEAKANQVTIRSRGQAGLFYGCQTLMQLLEDAADQQITIPACRITDYPDVPYR